MSLSEMSIEQARVFLKGYRGDWSINTDKSRGLAAPPMEKTRPLNAILVELVPFNRIEHGSFPLKTAIARRRSRREYSGARLTKEELSFLLWSTQGISETVRDDKGGVAYHLRTVPSSGARHPFETYIFIRNVENIRPGLYSYLPQEHKLMLLREDGALPEKLVTACYGQEFAGEAAAVFLWSAVPVRMEWKYGCIAHKLIAIEAGHVCQNLYLAAESIGAGACAISGYDQGTADELLGLDGDGEFVIYMASVGK
jgi:SagB-type dehydrogenase family enzyme